MIKTNDNNIREWSRELTIDFIADYKKLRVIWVPSLRYLKSDKIQALKSLCGKYNLTPDEVRAKIKVLRTSFHREHMRVLRSVNSNEIYVPKWYGYELLKFIVDEKKVKNEIEDSFQLSDSTIFDINFSNYEQSKQNELYSQNNDSINSSLQNDKTAKTPDLNTNDNSKEIFKSPEISNKSIEEITVTCDMFASTNSFNSNTTVNGCSDDSNIDMKPPYKRTKYSKPKCICNKFSNELLCQHCHFDFQERDEDLVFGESVALTLKNLKNEKSRIIAKHMINNILFDAQMGKLDQ